MKLTDENGSLNENHWLMKTASWMGYHYRLVRFLKIILILAIIGIMLLLIF